MPSIGKRLRKLACQVLCDESGAETLEYTLVAGLIVIAAIGAMKNLGTKVLARWTSLSSSY